MIIENTEALGNWLITNLEPLCDADPQALARYVIALIKKEKPEKDLKSVCLDQLEVFLQKETITFVDTLFETINNKSYIKSVENENQTQLTTNVSKTTDQTCAPSLPSNNTSSGQSDSPVVQDSTESANNIHNNNNNINIINQNPNSNQQSVSKIESNVSLHDSSNQKPRDVKRNRSRSRSRSPFRSVRRNDFDARRLGPNPNRNNANHFNDDRRRRGMSNNRRGVNQRFAYNRDRDYRRQRDLKRGRSRTRSRSFSSGSESRSRSRSRSRSWSRERESSMNKRSRPSSRTPSPPKSNPKDGEKSKRCRDYDEKGFCMKGDLCPFDHGNDPVVLDGNVSAALGLTNNNANNAPMVPINSSNLPPNNPNSYLAEPYNPEAPGIDAHSNPQQQPIHPPLVGPPPHRMPHPPHPYWAPMHPLRGPIPPNGPPLPPPQFMPPPGRPRELIGVPTIDNSRHSQPLSNRTVIDPNIVLPMGRGMRHMNRGIGRGYNRNVRRVVSESVDRTCLEVRKIPSNLNTISHLDKHFSKFGTIVNLQVCHEGDPEAALVQFASHSEALAAIRCTEAVLNNRFIKVFWHSKDQQQVHESTVGIKSETNDGNNSNNSKVSIKDRLGPKVGESNETVVTQVSPSGNISRTIFDRSKLKKTNASNINTNIPEDSNVNKSGLHSSADNKSKTDKIVDKNKKLVEYYTNQCKLHAGLFEYYKQLTDKLEKSINENDKNVLKKSIDEVWNKIQNLKESLKKIREEISANNKVKKPQTKDELIQELLNADIELHVKYQNNENPNDYIELADKYAELKRKAKALGISDYKSGKKHFYNRGRGGPVVARRGRHFGRNSFSKIDRRTRKILIPDINEDDITDLLELLAQYSNVEVIEPSSNGVVVTFKTRVDAEKATQNMCTIKFKENFQLNYSWFDEKKIKSDKINSTKPKTERKSISEDNTEMGSLPYDLILDEVEDEEDEEEDESEARNWK